MDQIGAISGPLIMSFAMFMGFGFRGGFAFLFVPAVLVLVVLAVAKGRTPTLETLETEAREVAQGEGKLPSVYWQYMIFVCLAVIGLVPFQIMAYHMKIGSLVADMRIPLYYALAMGTDDLRSSWESFTIALGLEPFFSYPFSRFRYRFSPFPGMWCPLPSA